MIGSTVQSYYKKVPLMDCTQFFSKELIFGAELS